MLHGRLELAKSSSCDLGAPWWLSQLIRLGRVSWGERYRVIESGWWIMESVAERRSPRSSDWFSTAARSLCPRCRGPWPPCRGEPPTRPSDPRTCFMPSAAACDFASRCLWVALVGTSLIYGDDPTSSIPAGFDTVRVSWHLAGSFVLTLNHWQTSRHQQYLLCVCVATQVSK